MKYFCAAILGCFLLATPPAWGSSLEVAEFLVHLRDRAGNERSFKSNIVPLVPNLACYGWRIRLVRAQGLIKMKEVFSLPAMPKFWSGENNEFSTNDISKDRRTAITEKMVVAEDRWISNSWCVAKGDPEGKYSMDVYINGNYAKRFEFEVRAVSRFQK